MCPQCNCCDGRKYEYIMDFSVTQKQKKHDDY